MAKLKALSTDCLITDWAYIACLWWTKKKGCFKNTQSHVVMLCLGAKNLKGSTILILLINLPLAKRKHFI